MNVKQVSFEEQLAKDISYITNQQVYQSTGRLKCM